MGAHPAKVDYRITSIEHKCSICGKHLKMNLVHKKHGRKGLMCYHHYRDMMLGTKTIRTAREIRRNPEWRSKSRNHIPLRASYA